MGNIWGAGYFQTKFLAFHQTSNILIFFPISTDSWFPIAFEGLYDSIIILTLWLSPVWPVKAPSSWLLCPFIIFIPIIPWSLSPFLSTEGVQCFHRSLLATAWNHALLQGALAPFGREEGSETKVWVLDWAHGCWAVIASGTSQQKEGRNISECVCFCIYTYMRPWAHVDTSNSNSTDQNSF